jgi:phosphate transport system protein
MMPDQQARARRHFHDDLDALQNRLMEMAGLVEEIVRDATEGFLAKDPAVSKRIKGADDRVDELEIEIDESALELLALQQPMAKDLRQIMSTLKVSNDLERVGDHGVNIAKAAKRLSKMSAIPEIPEVEEMIETARGMLADALAAWVSRNPGTARMVCIRDDKVDNLRSSLFRILVTHMLEDGRRISPALEILLVSQNVERIADLSTNIAEDVVFLVEGQTIKHHAEAKPMHPEDDEEPAT